MYFTYGELVVDFVDVFVDPAVVKQAMEEVVPGVFNNSTAKTLSQEVRPGGGHGEKWDNIFIDKVIHQLFKKIIRLS